MFEEHKAHKELKEYEKHLSEWQRQHDIASAFLNDAQTFTGVEVEGLVAKPGESGFLTVTNTSLIEERRGQGHYVGGSQGLSIPVASIGGRSIRYRVGASRGHYVQGAESPTAIDQGTTVVTNQRVVFIGAKQTREVLFAKLIAFHHDDDEGSTTFSVSNRQKPTVVFYGPKVSAHFDFRLDLALAHYNNTVPALLAQLEEDLRQGEAGKPLPPPPLPPK